MWWGMGQGGGESTDAGKCLLNNYFNCRVNTDICITGEMGGERQNFLY